MDLQLENEVRAVAFAWLDEQTRARGDDVLEGGLLRLGFEHRGQRIPMAVQQGIHKPKLLEAALSLRSSLDSPYSDHFDGEDTLVYRYRGQNRELWDNRAARAAFRHQLPLVYLHAVAESRYAVVRPVYIVADDPGGLAFRLKTEPAALGSLSSELEGALTTGLPDLQRSYGTRLVRSRLHQAAFREQVLQAYREQCAMCRLKHPRLLDAAHIDSDIDELGEPVVSNGLSLCRIHHAAFDVRYLSVEPNTYRVRVQPHLLREKDGPMLQHGLQALEGLALQLPRSTAQRPDPERLARHYAKFLEAS